MGTLHNGWYLFVKQCPGMCTLFLLNRIRLGLAIGILTCMFNVACAACSMLVTIVAAAITAAMLIFRLCTPVAALLKPP
jgi:hypothetical protein